MSNEKKKKIDYQISITPDSKDEGDIVLPEEIAVIPILNSPIFPGMIAPIILAEGKYTPELDNVLMQTGYLGLNLVKYKDGESDEDLDEDLITSADIYKVGVLCKIVKKLKLPDGSVNLLVLSLIHI